MDFIKTSSLRALIELTFQRNWNGLIWMSRKGVITKRVKTVQTALSRISAQPRSPAGRETIVRGRPKLQTFTPRRARPCRASRETRPRGRATLRVPRPMHPSEPGKNVPRPAEKPSAKSHPLDHAGRP
ncbi:unnamed protein product [Microthlaspi erraticum]|uniref:Uncharacterized protein n=1 Tax=Microthlaspi erraticum TaxID=1685480 RepID=A0A6D2KHD3_9BRAS|nr:unnamed protein product [Microthlaspi erraticum]